MFNITFLQDGQLVYLDQEGNVVPVELPVPDCDCEGIGLPSNFGKYSNISNEVIWKIKNADEVGILPKIGDGRLLANLAMLGNIFYFNISLTWGEHTEIPSPEDWGMDGFYFEFTNPDYNPNDFLVEWGLAGDLDLEVEFKSGGWYEGLYKGHARWVMRNGKPIITMYMPETAYKKDGKLVPLSYKFPSDAGWSKGSRISVHGFYEGRNPFLNE